MCCCIIGVCIHIIALNGQCEEKHAEEQEAQLCPPVATSPSFRFSFAWRSHDFWLLMLFACTFAILNIISLYVLLYFFFLLSFYYFTDVCVCMCVAVSVLCGFLLLFFCTRHKTSFFFSIFHHFRDLLFPFFASSSSLSFYIFFIQMLLDKQERAEDSCFFQVFAYLQF